MQEVMFSEALRGDRRGTSLLQVVGWLCEPIEPGDLRWAWAWVVRRHDALRIRVILDAGAQGPVQEFLEGVEPEWREEDWRVGSVVEGTGDGGVDARLERWLREDRSRGFEAASAPWLRVTLIRTGESRWNLVWTVHHLLVDGVSLPTVLGEVFEAYGARRAGRVPPEGPGSSFGDYARWAAAQPKEPTVRHWRELLAGLEEPTPPPVVEGRGRDHGVAGRGELSERVRRVALGFTARLKAAAESRQVTPATLVYGAWALLLARYVGVEEVVFGVVRSGRCGVAPAAADLVGCCINTLPLRVRVSEGVGTEAWLRDLHGQWQATRAHTATSWRSLAEASPLPPGSRLYHSLVLVNPASLDGALRARGGAWGARHFELREQPDLDWSLTAVLEDELELRLFHPAGVIDAGGAGRILDQVVVLLEGLISGEHAVPGEVPMMREEERRRVAEAWGEGPVGRWEATSLTALVEAQVDRTPGAVALVSGSEVLTFLELDRRANRLAGRLRRLGVGPEVPVAVLVERSFDLVVGILAVLKAGGAYVPLDPGYPVERLESLMGDAEVPFLLVQERLRDRLKVAPGKVRTVVLEAEWSALEREDGTRLGIEGDPDRLAYVIFTSGSTGRPKGVMVPHRAIVNHMRWMLERFPMGPEDAILQRTSAGFDASVWELFLPLMTGARMVLARPDANRDPGHLVDSIRRHGVTTVQFVPSLLSVFLEHPEAGQCRSLRRVFSGGEVLSGAVQRKVRERLAVELVNLYGPTETAIDATYWVCGEADEGDAAPIGRPVANTRVRVVDRAGRPVPAGVPGELLIGGAQVGCGYWRNPSLTESRFVTGAAAGGAEGRWYRTGDRCRWRADGVLEYLDRLDEQVKVRGWRVEIPEIEGALAGHPAVSQAAVVARAAAAGGPELVAFLVLRPGVEASLESVREHLGRLLPEPMVPRVFVPRAALPLTPNGKVDRKALRKEDLASAWCGGREHVGPRDAIEAGMVAVWESVLGLSSGGVGVEDDFFELGGHSLLAMQAAGRISAVLGIEMPVRWFFEHPTVAGLAATLRSGNVPVSDRIGPVPAGAVVPLSREQERLWFLHRALPGAEAAYNVPLAMWLRGELDPARLERAFAAVVARHALLRTAFVEVDGCPRQVVHEQVTVEVAVEVVSGDSREARERDVRRRLREEAGRVFDLTAPPLVRLRLLRLGPAEHVLVMVYHHLVGDEWSTGLLFEEIRAFWMADGVAEGGDAGLRALPVTYADYAWWQRRRLADAGMERHREYWRSVIAGAPLSIDWPQAGPRGAGTGGGTFRFELDAGVAGRLERLGRDLGLTPYMVWLATFQAFLHRLSGQDEVVVGMPVSLRTRPELQAVCGFFLNTLPLVSRLGPDTTFGQFLGAVRGRVLDAVEHQELPLDEILELPGGLTGAAGGRSLRASLVVPGGPPEVLDLPGIEAEAEPVDGAVAKFELSLFVEGSGKGGWPAWFEYDRAVFDEAQVARLAAGFCRFLSGLAGQPEEAVRRVGYLTEEERRVVVESFNRTAATFREDVLLHGLFAEQVRRSPGEVALEFEGRTLSYGELERRANQVANRLRALGVGVETLVGVCVDRSLELLVGLLGILKAGGAYVPLDPGYPAERLRFMVEDSEAGVVLVQERYRGLVARDGVRVVALDAEWDLFAGEATEAPDVAMEPGNLAYMIYTSGSTGRPKGVPNTHRGICNRLQWAIGEFPLGKTDAVLQKTPTSFDVSVWELFWPLVTGAREVLAKPGGHRDPGYLLDLMEERRVTVAHFVPSMLQVFLEAVGDRRLAGLRHVFCSGEAMWPELEKRFFEWSKAGLHNLYGPTEASVEVTRWSCREDSGYGFVPIGRPIANTRLYVLDPLGEPVGIGVRGELYIGGVQVARGYWKRPELTAERFVADRFGGEAGGRLYRTGDGCRWLADGILEYLGRLDSQVKVRGFRVELGEIEAVLGAHEGVSQAAVVVREGPGGGKELVAYVVGREGVEPEVESLVAHLGARVPEYMVPAVFVALDQLPLNPSGKVDRQVLVGTPGPGRALRREVAFEAPRNDAEAGLAALWGGVLKRERIGIREDFFASGGNSLLAIQVVARWGRELGREIPVRWLFEHPTVAGLVEAARQAGPLNGGAPVVPVADPAAAPLSVEQERLWFLEQTLADRATYHEPVVTRLYGALDVARLERAFRAVVRRQAVFRTAFVESPAGVRQVVRDDVSVRLPVEVLAVAAGETPEDALQRRLREEIRRPFDLTEPPLIRLLCLQLGAEEHVVAVTMHHLVCDEWSFTVLAEEIRACWEAETVEPAGTVPGLPALSVAYVDYARWQRRRLTEPPMDLHREFWRTELAGAVETLDLPATRAGGGSPDAGRTVRFEFEAALVAGFARLAREEGATPFMVWLAAYQAWLHRITGQEDLLTGTAVSLRHGPELDPLVGFFVNTLPVRSRVGAATTFRELLRGIRSRVFDVLEHRELPLDEILRGVESMGGGTGRPRSLPSALVFQEAGSGALQLPGLRGVAVDVDTGTAKFDLMLFVSRTDAGGWRGSLEFRTQRFGEEDGGWLSGCLRTMLRGLLEAPDAPVMTRSLVTDAERRRWAAEAEANRVAYPVGMTVTARFREMVAAHPDAEAVVCGGERLTYRGLDERSENVAWRLRELGVSEGSRVALYLGRSVDFVVAVLGVLKAGAAYVPLPVEYPAARLAFMLEDTAAAVVVVSGAALPDELASSARPCLDLAQRVGTGTSAVVETAQPTSPAYVMYTSGSTGQPKGVVVPHRAILRLVCGTDFLPWSAEQRFVLMAPTAFDASTLELWGPLLHGGCCVVLPEGGLDLERLGSVLREERVTCLWLTAGLFNEVVDVRPEILRPVRHLLAGGEALSVVHVRRAREALPGVRLVNGYGPTESTTFACTHEIGAADCAEGVESIPIGRPLANTRCRVIDGGGHEVPDGMPGELQVGGDGLALGYWNRPELTAERFVVDGEGRRWYRTGDRCRRRADGAYEFLGRLDEQVKVRGFRIEPGEIEAALVAQAGVRQAAVVPRLRGDGRRELVAFVVPGEGRSDPSVLRASLRNHLPEPMIPAEFVALERLPLTPQGKVDRRALPTEAGMSRPADAADEAPRDQTERTIAGVWADLLGREGVGIQANFFELGGHSLLAIRAAARIGHDLGIGLPVRWLFEHPTVESLAAVARSAVRRETYDAIEPVPAGVAVPLSHEQERLWFLHHALADVATYHVPLGLRWRGPLDLARLERALAALVARHPILRTGFVEGENGACQVVRDAVRLPFRVEDVPPGSREEREALVGRWQREETRRPFDLGQPPLMRAAVWRLDPTEHHLLITWHHLVCDEWSIGVMFDELRAIWVADAAGVAASLPELPVGYGDYAYWQRMREERRSGMDRHREYWRSELAGAQFEVDWPLPARAAKGEGGIVAFAVDGAAAAALERLGREEDLTPFMAWLGVFQGFLHRLTGQSDLVTGTPVSLRNRAELHGVVGFFLNTLPIRTRIERGTTFRQLLRAVRRGVLDGFEHQSLPLDEILRLDAAPAGGLRPRMVRVAFVMNDGGPMVPELPGLVAEAGDVDTGTAKFELTLFVSRSAGGGWQASLELGAEPFGLEAGGWLGARWAEALRDLVGAPEAPVRRRIPLPEDERRRVVEEFNRTAVEFRGEAVLHRLFEAQVARTPGAIALEFEREEVSYEALDRRANRVARRLIRLGVGRESLVAICAERSIELLVGLLGILKSGGAYVPLDPGYPAERLRFMVEDSGAGVVLVQRRFRDLVAGGEVRVVELDGDAEDFGNEAATSPGVVVEPDRVAYMIYTSGSTGRPKGVLNSHRGICNRLFWGMSEFPLGVGDVVMQKTPTSFDVSVWELFWPLVSGARELLARPGGQKDPVYLAGLIEERGVTVMHFVPSMLQVFLEGVGDRGSGALRHVFCSGEAMWPDLEQRFFAWSGAALHNLYGPTEAAVEVTRWTCRRDQPQAFVPIGKPIANTRLYVLDEEGEPVGVGVRGELYIGGVQVARGYWKRPELTAERFVPDRFGGEPGSRLYRTGDACRWMPDGNIEFLGRLDGQVKIRGFRVELGEVEAVLGLHPAVRQAAVVVRETPGVGKELVAFLVAREAELPGIEVLRAHLGERLPEYMVPAEFRAVEHLPLNPSGKVDRHALLANAGRNLRVEGGYLAPRGPVETALAAIWASLLGRERVGVRDDFFALGGHSLLALRMVFEARRRLGWTIPVSVLFAHPTIEGLVAAVGSPRPSAQLVRGRGKGPPLFFIPGVPGVNYLPAALLEAVGAAGRYCDALQYPGVDGKEAPLDTVEALASHLVGRLREIWPEGPFCLGGYSLGGNVAFEMARQLEDAGTPPVLVILFDAFAQDALRRRTWPEAIRATTRHLRKLGASGAVRFLWQRLRGKVQARHEQVARELGLPEADLEEVATARDTESVDEVRKRLFDASFRAVASHRARPYRGRVLLFRSMERDVAYGLFREVDRCNGWQGLAAGEFTVEDVPGDHWKILAEDKAGRIAERTAFHVAALERESG